MTSGTWRNLLCATLASAAWAFGAPAQAIAYHVGFDPTGFAGIITIDVSPTCLAPFPGTNTCAFDVTNVSFTDDTGMQWFDPAVPEGKSLLRTSYMATHTDEDLDQILGAFKKVGEQLRILG